jgi:mannosyl-3-phosphoglycerate phosphatase
LRPHTTIVFCAIDDLIPVSGKPLLGFPEFLEGLADARVPCVWVTSRSRHQLDSSLRRLGHAAPFVSEGGCGVFLPEDYFHLKPEKTVRLGRFTCIPAATAQPAAAEALESLAEQAGVEIVPLRSLSPRELTQNTGLSRDAAEQLRQRDFDELFFFAGASDEDIETFQKQAAHRKVVVRLQGSFWSLAVGANLGECVRQLGKLYDRALHAHAFSIALASTQESKELLPLCDRGIVLASRNAEAEIVPVTNAPAPKTLPLFASDTWGLALESIRNR